jgi:hypothetical protein
LALGSGDLVAMRNPVGATVVVGAGATVVVGAGATVVVGAGATVVVGAGVVVGAAEVGGVETRQPASVATAALGEPSLTSTVQSAGGEYGDRSTLKRPSLSDLPITTPSTVMSRLATAVPSRRSWPLLISARCTLTAALAGPLGASATTIATVTNMSGANSLRIRLSPFTFHTPRRPERFPAATIWYADDQVTEVLARRR